MLDINEIRKRAQQASEKATDAMKKTFEKSEELIDKLEVADLEHRPGARLRACRRAARHASGA